MVLSTYGTARMDFAEVYRVVMHAPTDRVAVQEGMTGARKTEDEEERKCIHPLPARSLFRALRGDGRGHYSRLVWVALAWECRAELCYVGVCRCDYGTSGLGPRPAQRLSSSPSSTAIRHLAYRLALDRAGST